jgi:hypothetical protein
VNGSWGRRLARRRSGGGELFLEGSKFLFELVDTERKLVEGERFQCGFDAANGGKCDESDDGANEKEWNENEEKSHGGGVTAD